MTNLLEKYPAHNNYGDGLLPCCFDDAMIGSYLPGPLEQQSGVSQHLRGSPAAIVLANCSADVGVIPHYMMEHNITQPDKSNAALSKTKQGTFVPGIICLISVYKPYLGFVTFIVCKYYENKNNWLDWKIKMKSYLTLLHKLRQIVCINKCFLIKERLHIYNNVGEKYLIDKRQIISIINNIASYFVNI